jgi:hypothetical protein
MPNVADHRQYIGRCALVAQLDRAPDFESGGREFESLRARQSPTVHSGDKVTEVFFGRGG